VSNLKKLDSVSDNDVIEFSESTFKIKKIRKLVAESIHDCFASIMESLMKKVSLEDKALCQTLLTQIKQSEMAIDKPPKCVVHAQFLQINGEWKPCKIRLKLELEVYTEEEETDVNVVSSADQGDSISPLDDIRQSIATNLQ